MTLGLSGPLQDAVEKSLEEVGLGGRVVDVRPVGGGCIHNGCRVETEAGNAFFLKWSPRTPPGMFEAEADGLRALGAAGALTVPEPVAWSDGPPGWLLMTFVAPGARSADTLMGERLARLHVFGERADFGWSRDNWIGSLPQVNPRGMSWGNFWRDARLRPQLDRARASGRLLEERFDRLLAATPEALSGVSDADLLHGDLWRGNAFTSLAGDPVLVDPAVYRGDGEVDLAMSELFGGFGRGFYEAYHAARPLSADYHGFKRHLYQLYYLLVHVNLFGATYEAGTRKAADTVLQALGHT